MVRFCDRPCGPQSMPWSLASVASEIAALLSAVTAEAGASKMYGLFWGSGQVPSVTDGLQVHHAQLGPGEELGDRRARARSRGSWPGSAPTAPGEVHVAAEAEGHGLAVALPVGVERRLLREPLGGDGGVVELAGAVVAWAPSPTPRRRRRSRSTGAGRARRPTANCRRRRMTLRETTTALCHTLRRRPRAGASLTSRFAPLARGRRAMPPRGSPSGRPGRPRGPRMPAAIMSRHSSKTPSSP